MTADIAGSPRLLKAQRRQELVRLSLSVRDQVADEGGVTVELGGDAQ
jgi:hypothetical protein